MVDRSAHSGQPAGDRRARLPSHHRPDPRAVLDLLRDPAPLPRRQRLRVRLPRAGGAGGVHRLRRPRRCDDRLLAQCRLDDGGPVLLGEGPGQPRAVLLGADAPDEHPGRHGHRRTGDDQLAGAGRHRHRLDHLRRQLRRRAAVAAGRRLPADDDPAVRDGDALRLAVPDVGSRGLPPRHSSSRSRSTSSAA